MSSLRKSSNSIDLNYNNNYDNEDEHMQQQQKTAENIKTRQMNDMANPSFSAVFDQLQTYQDNYNNNTNNEQHNDSTSQNQRIEKIEFDMLNLQQQNEPTTSNEEQNYALNSSSDKKAGQALCITDFISRSTKLQPRAVGSMVFTTQQEPQNSDTDRLLHSPLEQQNNIIEKKISRSISQSNNQIQDISDYISNEYEIINSQQEEFQKTITSIANQLNDLNTQLVNSDIDTQLKAIEEELQQKQNLIKDQENIVGDVQLNVDEQEQHIQLSIQESQQKIIEIQTHCGLIKMQIEKIQQIDFEDRYQQFIKILQDMKTQKDKIENIKTQLTDKQQQFTLDENIKSKTEMMLNQLNKQQNDQSIIQQKQYLRNIIQVMQRGNKQMKMYNQHKVNNEKQETELNMQIQDICKQNTMLVKRNGLLIIDIQNMCEQNTKQ